MCIYIYMLPDRNMREGGGRGQAEAIPVSVKKHSFHFPARVCAKPF